MDLDCNKEAFLQACYTCKYFQVKELANTITNFDFEHILKFGRRAGCLSTPLLAVSITNTSHSPETIEIVKFLISKGIKKLDIISGINTASPAIINFIQHHNKYTSEIVILLIKAGCDIDVYGPSCNTPLISAINNKMADMVHELIVLGCDLNFSKNPQHCPLDSAICLNNIEIVKMLINVGCDLSIRQYDYAVQLGFRDIAKLIKNKLDSQSHQNINIPNNISINTTAINTTAINTTAINTTAINTTAINTTAINTTAINTTAINTTAINTTAINTTAINTTAINTPSNSSTCEQKSDNKEPIFDVHSKSTNFNITIPLSKLLISQLLKQVDEPILTINFTIS